MPRSRRSGRLSSLAAEPLAPDRELQEIADYVCDYEVRSPEAFEAARRCFVDTLACALTAVGNAECGKLLGPLVPGATLANGARVPGLPYELDPASAAFNIGCLARWLDMNDTCTGASATHPSDALAGILAVADWSSRQRAAAGEAPLRMRDVMEALVKAYEIQCNIGAANATFGNSDVVDHVLLTKIAEAALIARMLGGAREQVSNALSNAWLEPVLRAYRHAPGTGSRKGWAAADASSQAVRLALYALRGEMGYPNALSAPRRGFHAVFRAGKALELARPYGEHFIRNTMFKFVPAAMYGQSAAEAAFRVHPLVRERLDAIERVDIHTHRSLFRIMDRTGPLHNAADRDHCVQYICAIGLIFGRLAPEDFEDERASDSRIDALRAKMVLTEDPAFTAGFDDPQRRTSATRIRVRFRDGSQTPRIDVEYPIGHPSRRNEAAPVFRRKLVDALDRCFSVERRDAILALCDDGERFDATPVDSFMKLVAA